MAPREKSPSPWESLPRHGPAQIRFLIALAVGIAVALLAPFQDTIPRILVGWNAGGWLYLILIGIKMAQAEVEGIKREAGIERERIVDRDDLLVMAADPYCVRDLLCP